MRRTGFVQGEGGGCIRGACRPLAMISTAALMLMCAVPNAGAATIVVTTTVDELNSDGDCSLREAIEAANDDAVVSGCTAGSGADTIILPAGTYELTRTGIGEDDNGTGDLDIESDIVIQGQGSGVTIIDGGGVSSVVGVDRVLHILFGTTELIDLAVRGGMVQTPGATAFGGGIYVELGDLVLNNTLVADNTSLTGAPCASTVVSGVGIYVLFGSLDMTNSQVRNNIAGDCLDSHGAGLYIQQGNVMITDSEIAGNEAEGTGGGIWAGGGLAFTLSLQRSTVSDNRAYEGGGLYLHERYLRMANSTISGNIANYRGGGLYAYSSGGVAGGLFMNNVTVANNAASATTAGEGGGLWLGTGLFANEFRNVIVADNLDPTGTSPDCRGSLYSAGYNLVEDMTGCAFDPAGDVTTNITGADPELDALADNGGATWTHAIPQSSPAFDTGACTDTAAAVVVEDQRGVARPQFTTCDIGAYEYRATTYVHDVTPVGPGDPNCPLGGYRIDYGPDLNGNGVLDPAEIRDTDYICNGYNSLVRITPEGAGGNCTYGGTRIETGLDNGDGGGTAADNILQNGEVDDTEFVCNGAPGGAGHNSLIRIWVEPAGGNCTYGGHRIDSGLDNGDGAGVADDGTLQLGEVDDSAYVCDGDPGPGGYDSLIRITAEPAGTNCTYGGQKVDSGLDNGDGAGTANDGNLHDGEVDDTAYICDGGGGSSGYDSLIRITAEPAGTNCTYGGQKVDSGLDNGDGAGTANDGNLHDGEVDDTAYICDGGGGSNGYDSLIRITVEPAGTNCTYGGQKVDSGLDNGDSGGTADDGTLQNGEVDVTTYICNGGGGSNGYDSLIRLTAEPAGTNCTYGGQKIDTGLDNGDGAGTANDGNLHDGEVDATAYVCDGGGGTAGHNSLMRLVALPVGDASCIHGGQRVDTGLDNGDGSGTADDGVLHDDEVDATSAICNGGGGSDGFTTLTRLTTLPVGDANCANGGQRVETGLDNGDGAGTANDGVLHADEVDATTYVCQGGNGLTGLVSQSDEPAGSNCENGGTRIDTGLDDDGDGILDPGEIDQTTYMCNSGGENGHDALTKVTPLPFGDDDCPDGGQRIDMGTDTDDDQILDTDEITGTYFVCSTGDGSPMVEGGGCSQSGAPPGLPLVFMLVAFGWLWIRRIRG